MSLLRKDRLLRLQQIMLAPDMWPKQMQLHLDYHGIQYPDMKIFSPAALYALLTKDGLEMELLPAPYPDRPILLFRLRTSGLLKIEYGMQAIQWAFGLSRRQCGGIFTTNGYDGFVPTAAMVVTRIDSLLREVQHG